MHFTSCVSRVLVSILCNFRFYRPLASVFPNSYFASFFWFQLSLSVSFFAVSFFAVYTSVQYVPLWTYCWIWLIIAFYFSEHGFHNVGPAQDSYYFFAIADRQGRHFFLDQFFCSAANFFVYINGYYWSNHDVFRCQRHFFYVSVSFLTSRRGFPGQLDAFCWKLAFIA